MIKVYTFNNRHLADKELLRHVRDLKSSLSVGLNEKEESFNDSENFYIVKEQDRYRIL